MDLLLALLGSSPIILRIPTLGYVHDGSLDQIHHGVASSPYRYIHLDMKYFSVMAWDCTAVLV